MIEFPITLTSGGSVCLPGHAFALALGYTKNQGVYRLHVDATGEWEGLTIRAFWHVPDSKDPASSLVADGYVAVPASVTAQPGSGCVTFEGSDGTKTVTSADLRYRVSANSGTADGTMPEPGTPAWQQLVDAVHTVATAAEQAKTDAQTAAQQAGQALSDTITAKEDALKAIGDKQTSATTAVESAQGKALDAVTDAQDTATQAVGTAQANAIQQMESTKTDALKAIGDKQTSATTAVESAQGKALDAVTDAQDTATQAVGTVQANAIQQMESTKTDALKAIGDKQTAATQAVDTARDKALQQVEASTEAAQTAASEAATSAGDADRSAQEAAGSLQELKDGIANGNFKGEPGNDGKSPVVTVTDIENGHRVSITDKDGTKTIDVLNGQAGKDGIQIDDATVGLDAWSSKHIVDMLCPPISETGNPVVCYPVENYPLGVTASWEPMQEGEGTPYPAGGGPNLLDISQCTATVGKPYGVTITIDGDVFKVSGVPSSEVTEEGQYSFAVASCTQTELRGKGYKITPFALKGNVSSAWGLRTEDEDSLAIAAKLTPGVNTDIQLRLMVSKDTPAAYAPYENIRPIKGRDSVTVTRCGENLLNPSLFQNNKYQNFNAATNYYGISNLGNYWISGIQPCSPNTTYRFNKNVEGGCFYDEKKNVIGIVGFDFTLKTPVKCAYYCVNFPSGSTPYGTPVIATVSESTTYAPYTGQTATLTLPHTIYGGEVDAVTGEGQEKWKLVTLDGTESWGTWGLNANNPAVTGFYTYDINDYDVTSVKVIGSHLVSEINGWGGKNVGIGLADGGHTRYLIYNMSTSLLPDISAGHEVASLKAYLAAQYAAGTPVQIAYKLATPTPIVSTGVQPIPALPGVNTALTDADSVTVTGRADPIKRITDLEDAVASMTNT